MLRRRPLLALVSLIILLGTTGCGYSETAGTSIDRKHLGSKYARQTGYMRMGGSDLGDKEPVPSQVRNEVVLDEVTLVETSSAETCFDATIRTSVKYDEPLSQLSPRCTIGGSETDARVSDVKVSVYDYDYRGRERTTVVEGVAGGEYVKLETSEPATKTFRVIERDTCICCPDGGSYRLGVLLENKNAPGMPFVLKFLWNLE
ncbi:MAG: hypothetical protein ABEN55_11925 [Bradymonadaceae bacterium]